MGYSPSRHVPSIPGTTALHRPRCTCDRTSLRRGDVMAPHLPGETAAVSFPRKGLPADQLLWEALAAREELSNAGLEVDR